MRGGTAWPRGGQPGCGEDSLAWVSEVAVLVAVPGQLSLLCPGSGNPGKYHRGKAGAVGLDGDQVME